LIQPNANRRAYQRRGWLLLTLLALLILGPVGIRPAYAAGLTVDSLADIVAADGACTLREAIINANNDDQSGSTDCIAGSGADTITFSVDGTITLGSTLPEIGSEITINGAGQSITLSGNNAVRVMLVNASGTLNLNVVTIAEGTTDPFEDGGAILNNGTLTVSNSTFSNNSADAAGGGIANNNTATVTNSTFSGNDDYAIFHSGYSGGTLTVGNSTIAGNNGGIVYIYSGLTLQNSIVANNGTDCYDPIIQGGLTADSFNIDSDGTCDNATTQTVAQLNLGSLTNNGGDTQTIALLAGSSAIDAGDDTICPAADQRGVSRPQGTSCDSGAFEADVTETDLSITKTDDIDPVSSGLILNYTIVVANTGAIAAENVVATDVLPAGVSLSFAGGDCTNSPSGATPTCQLGDIDAGSSKQFNVFVAVDGATSGVITNEASVTSDTPDPDLSNNTVTEETTVNFAGQPTIAIETLVSVDGGATFVDADAAPGPDLAQGGAAPHFKNSVTSIHPQGSNLGVPLSNVTVTDSILGTITGPASGDDGDGILEVGETWVYLATGTFAAGQNTHTGSADGDFTPNGGTTIAAPTATNDANYVGVEPVNSAPIAHDQDVNTDEDTALSIPLTGSDADNDALSYNMYSFPSHGTLSGIVPNLTYTPDSDYNGTDAFSFGVEDGQTSSNVATINITVIAVNDPPIAQDDAAITDQDTSVTIDIQANDSAGPANEDQSLSTTAVTDPAGGVATINADDTVTYTPDAGFTGTDSFDYTLCDSDSACMNATVTITVTADAAPFATCGGYDLFETAPGVYEAPGFAGNLIVGTNGYDWLQGTNGPDLILGLQGPDDIWGKEGDDVICGGDGVDIILGMKGNDTLFGDDQPDWLIGGPDNDTLYGGKGWDDLFGSSGQDTLHGEGGYDVLLGGRGGDDLFGGNGPDDLYGNRGDDDLNGGDGNDFCKGGPGKDTIAECESASVSSVTPDDVAAIDEEAARRSNDGTDGEHAIVKRIQELFLPLITR